MPAFAGTDRALDLDELIEQADVVLYKARVTGRNAVQVFERAPKRRISSAGESRAARTEAERRLATRFLATLAGMSQ